MLSFIQHTILCLARNARLGLGPSLLWGETYALGGPGWRYLCSWIGYPPNRLSEICTDILNLIQTLRVATYRPALQRTINTRYSSFPNWQKLRSCVIRFVQHLWVVTISLCNWYSGWLRVPSSPSLSVEHALISPLIWSRKIELWALIGLHYSPCLLQRLYLQVEHGHWMMYLALISVFPKIINILQVFNLFHPRSRKCCTFQNAAKYAVLELHYKFLRGNDYGALKSFAISRQNSEVYSAQGWQMV